MILKTTRGLCPFCGKTVRAEVIEEDGKVWIDRSCPEHGSFKDIYWSDAEMFKRFEAFEVLGNGIDNPQVTAPIDQCPTACGLCNNHRSQTLLGNIDLTNRCNLDCDFCFANARACGYVYEPSFDEVVGMMALLRGEQPVPTPAVQFSGGEPTLRDDLFILIRKAREMGFLQVQMATNGMTLSKDPAFAKELKSSGLSTVYLHFDGVTKETNPKIALDIKAVSHCEQAELGIVLVPTIIRGRNDHEVGDIIRFAADHIGVVRGVNFQPVSFTGAASAEDVRTLRITIPDLLKAIEEQTEGVIRCDDFYPVPCVVPVSDLVEAYTGKPQVRFTAHQHCGAATYVFVNGDELTPVTRMVDVEMFFASIATIAERLKIEGKIAKYTALLGGIKEMHAAVKKGEQGDTGFFWKLIGKALISQNFDSLRDFHWNALFIGTMHFMDRYNYDVARVQRCCIHYATPEGTLIPFCTYNSGPVFREEIWNRHRKESPKLE
jgi:hypothetical protein